MKNETKAGKKRTDYKLWQGVAETGGKKATLEELARAKREAYARGNANPAIVAIFERLRGMAVEEPIKFEFQDDDVANNFRQACMGRQHAMGLKDRVSVARCGSTVYLYNVEKW